jgi:hypothetical protein
MIVSQKLLHFSIPLTLVPLKINHSFADWSLGEEMWIYSASSSYQYVSSSSLCLISW